MTFELVGHRGAPAEAPENTLASFAVAEALGLAEIETDVRLSADGELFLLHDHDLGRVAAGPVDGLGPAAGLTLAQLRSVPLRAGERVPLLSELYDATTARIQLEIKAPEALPALHEFFAARPDAARRTMLTSFDQDAVAHAAALLPDLPRGVILMAFADAVALPEGPLGLVERTSANRILTGFDGLTAEWVARLRDAGCPTHVWPLRTADDLDRALALGATGGTADDPRTFQRLLAERAGA